MQQKKDEEQLANGAKMMVTLAGAMSTAEIGKIFAEMIRQDKVQIISCTCKFRRRYLICLLNS
jgi:deoxyhypusine synthase